MSDAKKFDPKKTRESLYRVGAQLRHYSLAIFLVSVGVIYLFILFQINSLSNAQPTPEAISNQVKGAQTPKIDQQLVNQLESLQDNSVSIQTLFEEARSNPFN